MLLSSFRRNRYYLPGSTLHGYLSKILARSCQDLGKILARYWQELQDAMVRSRKPCSQENFYYKILFVKKKI